MTRYWISWWQPGADPRPLHFPPKETRVLGWWRTGSDGKRTSICAVVAASTEWTAKAAVAEDWPESVDAEWRFVEQKTPDWTPGERFPTSNWMVPRLSHVASVPACPECNGTREVLGHAVDCTDDLCALNGDMHSCTGKMEPCPTCSVSTPLSDFIRNATPEQKSEVYERVMDRVADRQQAVIDADGVEGHKP